MRDGNSVVRADPRVTMQTSRWWRRDYSQIAAKMTALGPNVENLGTTVKGITLKCPSAKLSDSKRSTARLWRYR